VISFTTSGATSLPAIARNARATLPPSTVLPSLGGDRAADQFDETIELVLGERLLDASEARRSAFDIPHSHSELRQLGQGFVVDLGEFLELAVKVGAPTVEASELAVEDGVRGAIWGRVAHGILGKGIGQRRRLGRARGRQRRRARRDTRRIARIQGLVKHDALLHKVAGVDATTTGLVAAARSPSAGAL
jgi:hypothetical protein